MTTATTQRSLPHRVLDTFVAPGTMFEGFREDAPWVGPLLISIVIGVATVLLIPSDLFVQQAQEAMRDSGAGAAAPDPSSIAMFSKIMGAVGVAVVQPITAFLAAGILTLLFTVLLGGEARYKQHLAVTTHALLITTVGALLTVPLQVFSGDLQLRLSLSLLTPFLDPEGVAFRVLQGLDVFTLWAVVVLALGVSIVDRKHSWPFASAVLLGLYLVIDVGIALAFA